ncbi:MAG: fumarate hydratase [candidate division WOR-3 bacterium]
MKTIDTSRIKDKVKEVLTKINFEFNPDYLKQLKNAYNHEIYHGGKRVLADLLENAEIAKKEKIPICQDTGMVNFYVELGQNVKLQGVNLKEALDQAVREAYKENFLRPSVVSDPLNRVNTGDNTPSIIHIELTEGDDLTIYIVPKGGGSEQMCRVKMLAPHEGIIGVKNFVLETVKEAGPNPCPPVTIGIGIGGNFDYVAFLAKKALLRSWGMRNPIPFYEELEKELLLEINNLGLGPGGLGGKFYALDVRIEVYPTHIAQLPVAIAFNCSANRIGIVKF